MTQSDGRPTVPGSGRGDPTVDTPASPGASSTRAAENGTCGVGHYDTLCDLYRQSRGNHVYPLLAAHTMRWCDGFFAVDGHLGTVLHYRYCYDERERARRLAMLHGFSEALRECHSRICIRSGTDYHRTRHGAAAPSGRAAAPIEPDGQTMPLALVAALALLHAATDAGTTLSHEAKRDLFLQCWRFEMDTVVCAVVRAQADRIECSVVRALVLQPLLRLAYFPAHASIAYRDFSDPAEHLARAARAYDLAAARGWEGVEAAMEPFAAPAARGAAGRAPP